MSVCEACDVDQLVACLRQLGPLEVQPPWGRASARHDHIGAKLADAVLQSGIGYEAVVRPRVDRIASEYPSGQTTSGFLALLDSAGASAILNVKSGRKLLTIRALTEFLAGRGVETPADLRSWLQVPGNTTALKTVYGVGPKTVSFLKLLVGLDAIAVDRQILRFVHEAGVNVTAPDAVEELLTKAGQQLSLSAEQIDQLVWRFMAARGRDSHTSRNRRK